MGDRGPSERTATSPDGSEAGFELVGLDHVQLAMPPGEEATAEAFYCGLLGLRRLPKPEPLASRGGCWFATGPVVLHLGVEQEFRPARKAHPALLVAGLDHLVGRLADAGVRWRPDHELEGVTRGYVDDPFGNRIELIAAEPQKGGGAGDEA